MHTDQKEHKVPEFEQFVRCPSPPRPDAGRFHMVPRSTATIHEYAKGQFSIDRSCVATSIQANPADLVQMASDALLLAEHLAERQSALQDAEASQKDAQALDKEAQALFESIGCVDWHYTTGPDKAEYLTMARKAREIHGVSK